MDPAFLAVQSGCDVGEQISNHVILELPHGQQAVKLKSSLDYEADTCRPATNEMFS